MTFVVGHPIRHWDDFYGRFEQLARFFEIIDGGQAQSLSLRGLRRAGKTSFLQHVAHPKTLRQYMPDPDRYVMVYIDISLCRTPAEFYFRLARALQAKLEQHIGLHNSITPQPQHVDVYTIEDMLNQFGQKRIVLLLDEFDRLKTGTFNETFLVELRALTSGWEYELACVTSSYWDLYYLGTQMGLPPTSPFYNIFHPSPIFMSGLVDEEAVALIAHVGQDCEIPFTERDTRQIVTMAGHLPFLIQTTAAMWAHYKASRQPLDKARLGSQLILDLAPYFSQWWENLLHAERDVLRTIAAHQPLDELKADVFEVNKSLNHLQQMGLITLAFKEWRLDGQLFPAWIRQYGGSVGSEQPQIGQPTAQATLSPSQLRLLLIKYFDMEELRDLCFDLDVDFEQLPGSNKGAKARELIIFCRKRGELNKLITAVSQTRKIPIES